MIPYKPISFQLAFVILVRQLRDNNVTETSPSARSAGLPAQTPQITKHFGCRRSTRTDAS
jgi:hypothetical protein